MPHLDRILDHVSAERFVSRPGLGEISGVVASCQLAREVLCALVADAPSGALGSLSRKYNIDSEEAGMCIVFGADASGKARFLPSPTACPIGVPISSLSGAPPVRPCLSLASARAPMATAAAQIKKKKVMTQPIVRALLRRAQRTAHHRAYRTRSSGCCRT